MSAPPKTATIIGAGLGGMTLALALKQLGIQPTIYELRTPEYDFGGAIMLSPNAIRVLDVLGMYTRIRNKGYNFDTLTFVNDHKFDVMGNYYFGEEKRYGYQALRVYRNVLLKELRNMVEEKGIQVHYGRKFQRVVNENETGVTFAFADGETSRAELLIGADGIHSKVRSAIEPDIEPKYSGFLGVTYAFPRTALRLPEPNFPLPVSIHGKNGAFIMAPQNADGDEIFAGRQFKHELESRSGWDELLRSKDELIAMHQADMDQWSAPVRSAQEQISKPESGHALSIWPFHTVPKLSNWSSEIGRVVIVGDAAHAIPPTAGQGANQAFEDSYSLAVLLTSIEQGEKRVELKEALGRWQAYRQERVDKVLVLSDKMNNIRLSEEEKKLLPVERVWHETEEDQLAWLYLADIKEDVEALLAE